MITSGQPSADESVESEPIGSHSSAEENQARLRAAQMRFLPRMISLCARAHPHYERVFRELGLTPGDFNAVEDLRKLPLLYKKDYVRDPEAFRLNLENVPGLSTEEYTLADVIYTSGSSGKPAPFYDTMHDRFLRIELVKRATLIAGVGPQDVVMNLFPLSSVPHQGFLTAMWGSMSVGSKLLSSLTGRGYPMFPIHNRVDDAVEMIESQKVTVLWGITTFVRRVVIRAQELGKDLSSVRLVFAMGEACPAGMREDIRSRLRTLGSKDPIVNNGYGFTEMQGPSIECVEFGGTHLAAPEQFYFEVVDPDTGATVPDGEKGLLVMSHLNRRGTVLLRFVVGDILAMTHETCPHCRRWLPRFLGTPHRADGLVKVKGTLIDPAALSNQLDQLHLIGVAEYQIVVTHEKPEDPFSSDAFVLRLACAPETRERVTEEVKGIVSSVIEITPALEFLPEDGFSEIGRDLKFKRFVDNR